ncbi:TPA: hypothetical protein U1C34_000693 [Streptococcus suis]|nr:hypothetical protein [Streptococcus suis]HEM3621925.1 hypothetical protein [Streptococcus suis]
MITVEKIERFLGRPIGKDEGVIQVQYQMWWPSYLVEEGEQIELQVHILGDDEDIDQPPRQRSKRFSDPIFYDLSSQETVNAVTKRPFPNKNYISLASKNNPKHHNDGYLIVGTLDKLRTIRYLQFSAYGKQSGLDKCFVFSVDTSALSPTKPFMKVRFQDMAFFNRECMDEEIYPQYVPTLTISNPQMIGELNESNVYQLTNYIYSPYQDILEKELNQTCEKEIMIPLAITDEGVAEVSESVDEQGQAIWVEHPEPLFTWYVYFLTEAVVLGALPLTTY